MQSTFKALLVTNIDVFFLTNRLEQAKKMQQMGYEVHILAANTGKKSDIESYGFIYHELPFNRFGLSIKQEIKAIKELVRLYRKEKFDVIHHLGMKPIVMGSLAALFVKKTIVFNTYTGLGYPFMTQSLKARMIRYTLFVIFRILYHDIRMIAIFQNKTDYRLFIEKRIVKKNQAYVIRGCGVDMEYFKFDFKSPSEVIKILLPGKILASKGILEFIHIAEVVKSKKLLQKSEFILCGGMDNGHPFSIDEKLLSRNIKNGTVVWLGNQNDMAAVYREVDIVVLPSVREGLPKSLLEAGATGRPMITYDVPGCNEVVINGYNGFVVPYGDVQELEKAVVTLIENASLRKKMGENAYKTVKDFFSNSVVIKRNLALYAGRLINKKSKN